MEKESTVGVQLVFTQHNLWTFSWSIVVHFCEACFVEIICFTRPDTSKNCSQYRKVSTWSKGNKDGNKVKLE